MGWMEGMMYEEQEHVRGWAVGNVAYIIGAIGILLGVMITVTAVMLYVNPKKHELAGALVVVFSVTSLLSCMSGLGV